MAKQLRDVVDANWSSKTWGPKKKKPKGITAIGEAMDQVEGALAKLTAAQKKAADANEEDSFWRTKLSKAFYQAVAEVQPGQARSVLKLESDLAGISAQL